MNATARFELLDHIPDGCLAMAADGTVLFWNVVLESWTGRSRALVVGRSLYELFPRLGQPRYRSRIEQTVSLGAPTVLSALLTPPFFSRAPDDGRRRFEQVTVTRLSRSADGGHEVLVTIRDVTEQYDRGTKFHDQSRRANAEAELRRAQARELEVAIVAAESATRAKSLFLASMSHELRTPMNGVLGMADVLLHSDLTSWQRENVEVLQASASSLLTVLNDVLDFSKIEADKLEVESIPFDPRSIVEECAILVAELAHAKDIECTAIVEPSVPERIMGDPVRLRQVLMNLLSNAIKFTAEGEVVVSLRATDADGAPRLTCEVKDTGGGISAETCARLFEPFTQAGAATSRLHGGTGLGLSICRRLMRLMGGDIVVESELGRGSVFRFDMPSLAAPPEQGARSTASPGRRGAAPPKVGVCLAHASSARAIAAQLEVVGASACLVTPASLSGAPLAGLTHLIVDPVMLDALGDALGALRARNVTLVLATRPSSSRGLPPAGFQGVVPMPCRRSTLEHALSMTAPRAAAPSESAPLGMRVLVAEDDRTNQLVVRAVLTRLGCTLDIVPDGAAAVASASGSAYDVVLMDMQMPVMGGCEAAATLRQQGYTGPIVALTASVLAEEQAACLASGMNAVLTKPLDRASLAAMLLRWKPAERAA